MHLVTAVPSVDGVDGNKNDEKPPISASKRLPVVEKGGCCRLVEELITIDQLLSDACTLSGRFVYSGTNLSYVLQ